jgi:hypothetical protein
MSDVHARLGTVKEQLDTVAAGDTSRQPLGNLQQGLGDALGQVESLTGQASVMGDAFVGASGLAEQALGSLGMAGAAGAVGVGLAAAGAAVGLVELAFRKMGDGAAKSKKRVEEWSGALKKATDSGGSSMDAVNSRVTDLVNGSTKLVGALKTVGATGGDLASAFTGKANPAIDRAREILKEYEAAQASNNAQARSSGASLDALAAKYGMTRDALLDFLGPAQRVVTTVDQQAKSFDTAAGQSDAAKAALSDLSDTTGDAADATDRLNTAYDTLSGALDVQSQALGVRDAFADIAKSQADAGEAVQKYGLNSAEAAQAGRDLEGSTISLNKQVLTYAQSLGNVPPEVVSSVLADIDDGTITTADQVLARLANAPRVADVKANPTNVAEADKQINGVADKSRTANVTVTDVGTTGVDRDINNAARDRTSTITVHVNNAGDLQQLISGGGGAGNLPRSSMVAATAMPTDTPEAGFRDTTVNVRPVLASPIVVNVRAGVIGNRDEVTRAVIAATKRGRRLVGARGGWTG